VSTIGWGSLKNCPNLTSLTILREEPPVIQVFLYNSIGLSENCTIYVPAESVELYKNDVNWGEFASQVKAIP
ncbi:MAG: hypothetical protein ACSW8D_08670, partial [Prevotella sp.]